MEDVTIPGRSGRNHLWWERVGEVGAGLLLPAVLQKASACPGLSA